MQKIFDAIKSIWKFFEDFWDNFIDFFKDIFEALWLLVKDFFFWVLETILELAKNIISAMDFTQIEQYASSFGSLPADVLNIMGLIGLGYALGIIFTAISIRFLLQLVPFTRLGS